MSKLQEIGRRIRLTPGHRIPLWRQVAAQLSVEIRGRGAGRGEELPAVRALARELGLHRETVRAAYALLEEQGLVEVRGGSGVRVPGPPVPEDGLPLGDAFRRYLARERAAGRSCREIASLFRCWYGGVRARRLLLVGEAGGDRSLRAAELSGALPSVSVETSSPADLRSHPERLHRGLAAAMPAAAARLRDRLPPWSDVYPLRLSSLTVVRALLLRVPADAPVALVTGSRSLRRRIEELAAGLRGDEVPLLRLEPGDLEGRSSALEMARFVLTDLPGREAAAGRRPGAPVVPVRSLGRGTIAGLRRFFEETGPGGDASPRDAPAGEERGAARPGAAAASTPAVTGARPPADTTPGRIAG